MQKFATNQIQLRRNTCVVVLVHHPTRSSPANLSHRYSSTLRSILIASPSAVRNSICPKSTEADRNTKYSNPRRFHGQSAMHLEYSPSNIDSHSMVKLPLSQRATQSIRSCRRTPLSQATGHPFGFVSRIESRAAALSFSFARECLRGFTRQIIMLLKQKSILGHRNRLG